jgi:MFS family permease
MAGAIPGMIAIIAAWHYSSLTLMILGSVFCGASVGMAYLGSITAINQLAAPSERGSVNSLYFVIVYLFFSIPPIALGFAATRLGLHAAVDAFACLIALLTLLEMVWLNLRRRAVRQGSTGAASEKDDG